MAHIAGLGATGRYVFSTVVVAVAATLTGASAQVLAAETAVVATPATHQAQQAALTIEPFNWGARRFLRCRRYWYKAKMKPS